MSDICDLKFFVQFEHVDKSSLDYMMQESDDHKSPLDMTNHSLSNPGIYYRPFRWTRFLERGNRPGGGTMWWWYHGIPPRCLSLLTRFPAQNSLGSLIWTKVFGLYITQHQVMKITSFLRDEMIEHQENIVFSVYSQQQVVVSTSFSRLHSGMMNVYIHEYNVISSTAEKSNYDLSIMLQSFIRVHDILNRSRPLPIGWKTMMFTRPSCTHGITDHTQHYFGQCISLLISIFDF